MSAVAKGAVHIRERPRNDAPSPSFHAAAAVRTPSTADVVESMMGIASSDRPAHDSRDPTASRNDSISAPRFVSHGMASLPSLLAISQRTTDKVSVIIASCILLLTSQYLSAATKTYDHVRATHCYQQTLIFLYRVLYCMKANVNAISLSHSLHN